MKIHTHEKLVSKNSFISSQTVPSHFCHLYTKPQKPIYGPPLFYHWQQQVFKSASENTKIGQSSQRKQSNLKYTPKGACMHSHTNNNHFSFFFFLPRHTAWKDLPQPGIKPIPPALGTQSLNFWTFREVQ